MNKLADSWNEGDPYEYFMGRWSKLVAREFLAWLKVPENLTWLDIGCGTGVLGEAIFTYSKPKQLFSIDPQSHHLDEGVRFPICNSENLKKAFIKAGLTDVTVTKLDIVTVFNDFEDYWNPFLGGQGPAPSYLASLSEDSKEELRNRIFNKLPIESNGLIKLLGRAIAIKGKSKEINNFT